MVSCEICGRAIRTGRKYCWEHRHTAQANSIRGEKLIDDATKKFKDEKLSRGLSGRQFEGGGILIAIGTVIVLGSIVSIIDPEFRGTASFVWLFIGVILLVLGFVIVTNISGKVKDKVKDRDEEYIGFVKDKVRKEKEEREFRKSLLRV